MAWHQDVSAAGFDETPADARAALIDAAAVRRARYSSTDAEAVQEGEVQESLVRRAQRGDEHAFALLVPAAAERLLGVAYRILRDASLAEDATQQALLDAWRGLPKLRDPERFDAWTYRLVVHACYAELRRRRPWRGLLSLVPGIEPAARDELRGIDERDRLDRGFSRLSPEHRAVVVLHHHVGLPLAELAQALGIPPGTARSRLHYATRALRASLEDDATTEVPHAR